MHTGLLWFDNSIDTLDKKIQKAADYYFKKYGRQPDLVLVHPSALKDKNPEIQGVTIRQYRPILPGYLWLGIEDKSIPHMRGDEP